MSQPEAHAPSAEIDRAAQDDLHLRLLSIFHFVVGGFAFLFSCFFLVHVGMGFAFLTPGTFASQGEPPPAFVGWLLMIMGGLGVLAGWTYAALMIAAGRSLAARRRHTLCLVMAGISCAFLPFGTALGVLSLIVLTRPSVQRQFAAA
jgi:hypothetical protein